MKKPPKTPDKVWYYAYHVVKRRVPEYEEILKKHSGWACCYARDVIEGRWAEGEEIISKDADWSCYYARDVIKCRFLEGEKVISKGGHSIALYYVRDVILPILDNPSFNPFTLPKKLQKILIEMIK